MGYKPITNWDDIQVVYVFQVPFLEAPWTGIPSAERHDKALALHARCSDIPWRCTWGIWEKNRRKLEWDFFSSQKCHRKKKTANCGLQWLNVNVCWYHLHKKWFKNLIYGQEIAGFLMFPKKKWCSDSQWVELLWIGQGHIFLAQFFHHLHVVSCYCMLLPTMSVVIIIW